MNCHEADINNKPLQKHADVITSWIGWPVFSCEDSDKKRDQEVWPASLLCYVFLILVDLGGHHWPSLVGAGGYPKYPQGWLPYFP